MVQHLTDNLHLVYIDNIVSDQTGSNKFAKLLSRGPNISPRNIMPVNFLQARIGILNKDLNASLTNL